MYRKSFGIWLLIAFFYATGDAQASPVEATLELIGSGPTVRLKIKNVSDERVYIHQGWVMEWGQVFNPMFEIYYEGKEEIGFRGPFGMEFNKYTVLEPRDVGVWEANLGNFYKFKKYGEYIIKYKGEHFSNFCKNIDILDIESNTITYVKEPWYKFW